jgi:4-amino-4-deoxy-L-arabinose transferase-like glycosyltransferase
VTSEGTSGPSSGVAARAWLAAIVAIAGALDLWALNISGYGNGYYAEGALAASRSWTALFTNAADPSGLVSLDKGPLPDWIMGLSTRVFGFSSLSMLLPNAVYGMAAVVVLYDLVQRTLGRRTALLAALLLALSPVSVVMARYDNPDSLLALLLVGSGWALVRALESGRTRHMVWCGALLGLAFNTKMLEAYLVLPALACAFLLAAPGSVRRRVRQLLAGAGVMLAVSVAWYGTMMLIPAGDRPYVGETTDNSWFQLIFDANGVKRVTGFAHGGQGRTGPLRLFFPEISGQIAWLLPLALAGFVLGLWLARRAPRTDRRRAAVVLFGIWLLVGYGLFSFSRGIFHSYYTSAITAPVAALAATAIVTLAERVLASRVAAAVLAGALLFCACLSFLILYWTPEFVPWLRSVVLVAGVLAALGVALLRRVARRSLAGAKPWLGEQQWLLSLALAFGGGGVALLAGPTAYSVATVGFGRTGSSPTAGPPALTAPQGRLPPAGSRAVRSGAVGVAGGVYQPRLLAYLEGHRGGARYLVAAEGSQFAAPIGLASQAPVVTVGGFSGGDPAPDTEQLADLIRSGELRYVLLAFPEGSPAARKRSRWVASRCTLTGVPYLAPGEVGGRQVGAAPVGTGGLGAGREADGRLGAGGEADGRLGAGGESVAREAEGRLGAGGESVAPGLYRCG